MTCGGGVRHKERPCNNPEPKYSGKSCEEQEQGPSIETESCNTDPCPGNFKLKRKCLFLKKDSIEIIMITEGDEIASNARCIF